jgi:CHAD domain-containing protein
MRDFARHQTAILIRRLALALNRAAREADAEAIHDVRVALRRLSRCLRVFAPFYPAGSWKKIRRRLSALGTAAGAVRDCDIAIELAHRAGIARRSAIVSGLAMRRRKAGHDLTLEIRRWKSRDLVARWRNRLVLGVSEKGDIPEDACMDAAGSGRHQLPPLVSDYFAQVRQLLASDPPPAELHAIRLASKRLRYTLELFRPVYGPGLSVRLATLQRLQQVLGEVNDCAAAERQLAELPASPERSRVEHFLRRRAAAKAVTLRKEWRESFDAPGREQWWLRYLARNARTGAKRRL